MNEADTGTEKKIISFSPSHFSSTTKTPEIKLIVVWSAVKFQSQVFKEGTSEEFLHCIHVFSQAKGKLGYAACTKLESGMEQLLPGNPHNKWDTIKNIINQTLRPYLSSMREEVPSRNCICPYHQQLVTNVIIFKGFRRVMSILFHNS